MNGTISNRSTDVYANPTVNAVQMEFFSIISDYKVRIDAE